MTVSGVNKIIITAACLLLVHSTLFGQQEKEYIRKGNRLYKKSEYTGSEGMYRRAQAQERSTYDSGFNLGDALYKQGKFSEAASEFMKTAKGSDADSVKQAQSFYNLGNSLLKDQKFEESINAYINSLKLDPGNVEAKYNLAYAQDQLKKQQQQQKDQQQDQNKKDEEKKDDQKQKDDQQQKQQDQKDQQEQQQQQGQDQQQQQSISREDAKRLLDALSANEKDTQEKVQRDKAARAKVRVIKNW